MKDIILCDALNKTLGGNGIIAVHHFMRETAVPSQHATVKSLAWSVFESMPSVDQFIMVEHGIGEVDLIMKDNPTSDEIDAGTNAIYNVSPGGVVVRGHVFNDKDFESVKQIKQ